MRSVIIPFATAIVLFFATHCLAQNGSDIIVVLKGTRMKGKVLTTSRNEVTLQTNGQKLAVPVNQIDRISFAGAPIDLRAAQTSIRSGQLENALIKLNRIDPGSVTRDLVAKEIAYYKAHGKARLALAGKGKKLAAARQLGGFLKTNPQTYHYYQAVRTMGDLATSLGRYQDAATNYGRMGEAPWPEYQMQAEVLQGRALLAQNQIDAALAKFESVLAVDQSSPAALRQKMFASLGKAVSLAETGKHQQGVRLVEEVIDSGDPEDALLLAQAYNALGRCHQKAGKTKDALLAYLHVDILFYRDGPAHAEALFHLSKLWTTVDKPDRAEKARNLLTQRYGGSLWATLKQ